MCAVAIEGHLRDLSAFVIDADRYRHLDGDAADNAPPLAAFQKAEIGKWWPIIKAAGIGAD